MLGKIDAKAEAGPGGRHRVRTRPHRRLPDDGREAAARTAGTSAPSFISASGKFGAQMKYADKRGSPCVVIQGGDEKAKGEVQIKDLILGAEIAGLSKDRDDYLKKQAEAQFAVKESELVDAVKKVLARNNVTWG